MKIQKMDWIRKEKVASLWRAEWKGFGSKSECIWMEIYDDNGGVQVGLKVGLSLTIFLEKKKETVNLSLR